MLLFTFDMLSLRMKGVRMIDGNKLLGYQSLTDIQGLLRLIVVLFRMGCLTAEV